MYPSLHSIGDSEFESTDVRLYEALSDKITGVAILQDDIDAAVELQTRRREQGFGLSVLYLLRLVMDKISPAGTESGQRSRSMKIIGKLEISGPPLIDLEHFLVRIARAKAICLNGSTEPAVVAIVEELLFEKLRSEIESKHVTKSGPSPTLYEFGYSNFLMHSDDPAEMTYNKLYMLIARWLQFKTTTGADRARDNDAEAIATGKHKHIKELK